MKWTVFLALVLVATGGGMGNWQIIQPEAATNAALNPVAGTTGNFATLGGATATRSSTYAMFGLYSYRVQTSGDDEGISLTLAALDNADQYVTVRERGTLPSAWDWSLDDGTYTAPTAIEMQGDWTLYGLSVPSAQANGSTTLYIRQNGAGSGDFYVDGVNVVEADHWTTHIDGERPGCAWNGEEHASTSSRSGQSLAGGRVYDLTED